MNIPDGPGPVALRHQIGDIPAYVLTAWRSRYVAVDGIDLEARAILNQEAAAVRAGGDPPDALTVWVRLCDTVVRVGSASPELLAATALAGLAAGVRTQGFHAPDVPKPATADVD